MRYESLHIMELLSLQCLQVDDVIPIWLPAVCRCGSQTFAWWHYLLMVYKVYSGCGFSKATIQGLHHQLVGIAHRVIPLCAVTHTPSLSCLFSFYTIPISPTFNSKNFSYSSLLPFFYCMHACTVTRCPIVMVVRPLGLVLAYEQALSRYFPTVMYVD